MLRFTIGLFAMGPLFSAQIASLPENLVEIRNLIDTRQLGRAEELVVRQITAAGRTPEWILLLAEIRLDQQRHSESLQLLDGARQLGDFSAQNRLLAGLNYVALSRLDLAEPELRAAIQQDASNPRSLYYLGRLLYTKNSFEEAIEMTQAAIRLDPEMVRAYDNLGLCYEGLQKYVDAEKAYQAGIRKQRSSGAAVEWPALNLGTMLLKNGAPGKAKIYLEEALRINPKSAEAYFRLGSVLEQEKRPVEAIEQYRQATSHDPHLAKAYYRSGILYHSLGKETEAREQFSRFEQLSGKK